MDIGQCADTNCPKDSITGDYSVYDSIYSNNLLNSLYSEQLELNYRWVQEKFDLMVGARAIAQQTHSRTYYGNTLARDTLLCTSSTKLIGALSISSLFAS